MIAEDRIENLKRALALIIYSDFIDLQMARDLAKRALEIDTVMQTKESVLHQEKV